MSVDALNLDQTRTNPTSSQLTNRTSGSARPAYALAPVEPDLWTTFVLFCLSLPSFTHLLLSRGLMLNSKVLNTDPTVHDLTSFVSIKCSGFGNHYPVIELPNTPDRKD